MILFRWWGARTGRRRAGRGRWTGWGGRGTRGRGTRGRGRGGGRSGIIWGVRPRSDARGGGPAETLIESDGHVADFETRRRGHNQVWVDAREAGGEALRLLQPPVCGCVGPEEPVESLDTGLSA